MTLAPGEFIRRFMLHVLPKGFHRIRHYGLLASSRTKADTIARARELIAGGAATAIAAGEAGSGTRRHRGDRQAGPSLPVLRWPHGHHRDVRGRLHAATSADRAGDRDQDRHVMMPVAAISLVTADRLCCWLTAGNDDAWPRAPSAALARTPIAPAPDHCHGTDLGRHLPVAACLPPPAAASIRARCTAAASQIPIAPAEPGAPHPAPSFPGGFRTPAPVRVERSSMGRHPKPVTLSHCGRPRLGAWSGGEAVRGRRPAAGTPGQCVEKPGVPCAPGLAPGPAHAAERQFEIPRRYGVATGPVGTT